MNCPRETVRKRQNINIDSISHQVLQYTHQLSNLSGTPRDNVLNYQEARRKIVLDLKPSFLDWEDFGEALDICNQIFPYVDEIFLSLKESNQAGKLSWAGRSDQLVSEIDRILEKPFFDAYQEWKTQLEYFKEIYQSKTYEDAKNKIKEVEKNALENVEKQTRKPILHFSYDEVIEGEKKIILPSVYLIISADNKWYKKHKISQNEEDIFIGVSVLRGGWAASWLESAIAIDGGAFIFFNDLLDNNEGNVIFIQKLLKNQGLESLSKDEILNELIKYVARHEIGHSKYYVDNEDARYDEKDKWSEFLADAYLVENTISDILLENDDSAKLKKLIFLFGFFAMYSEGVSIDDLISDNNKDQDSANYHRSRLRILRLAFHFGLISTTSTGKLQFVVDEDKLKAFIGNKGLKKYIKDPLSQEVELDESNPVNFKKILKYFILDL